MAKFLRCDLGASVMSLKITIKKETCFCEKVHGIIYYAFKLALIRLIFVMCKFGFNVLNVKSNIVF